MLTRYTLDDEKIKKNCLPYPRDGHSAHLFENNMIIFGGDRNRFPYNDLFVFKLE